MSWFVLFFMVIMGIVANCYEAVDFYETAHDTGCEIDQPMIDLQHDDEEIFVLLEFIEESGDDEDVRNTP